MVDNSALEPNGAPEPSPKKKKRLVVVGVIAAVVVVAGAGFWIWHEQPSFCGSICHTPMAEYVDTYDQEADVAGVDKYGNAVENTSGMLAVTHRVEGENCLSCHVSTLGEQVSEGMNWVSGNYTYPLDERATSDLTEARGLDADEFCLNGDCHDVTNREELIAATSDLEFNPHESQHGEIACTDCHKAHRASVMICAQCHDDEAEVPEGWVVYEEGVSALPGYSAA